MDQTNSQNKKPRVGIGTIGHPGHGKTTLTQAITDYLPKKEKKEFEGLKRPSGPKKNALVSSARMDEYRKFFDPPWWEYETKHRLYVHTDWPEDPVSYVNKLVTRARQLDGAILVVAASEGIMPQTRQHLLLIQHIGVPKVVVFMNKTDLVDDAQDITRVEREIRALLNQYQFDGEQTPIIKGSARKVIMGEAEGIEAIAALLAVIDQHIPTPLRPEEKPFLMPVEDIFSFTGQVPTGRIQGTVATGRIERGVINAGDPVEIVGLMKEGEKPLTAVVTGVEMFRKIRDRGEAGDNVCLGLRGIDKEAIRRGMVIYKPGSRSSGKVFTCEVYVNDVNEGNHQAALSNGNILEFRSRTASVLGQIKAPQKVGRVPTGSIVRLEVTLDSDIAMDIGLFIVILEEENRPLGLGKVIQILDSDYPH